MTATKHKVVAIALVIGLCGAGFCGYLFRYEIWLASSIWSETGFGGLVKPRSKVRLIGHLEAPTTLGIYPSLDVGNFGNSVTVHDNGCFILSVPGSKASFGVLAEGFKSISGELQSGYYRVQLSLAEVTSSEESRLSIKKISLIPYLRGMRACQQP